MLLKFAGRILLKSWGRPPAYRLFTAPVLALFGFHAATARLVSLACFALSAWFIYAATKLIANQASGAFAVLVFCLAPQIVSASIWFGSEGPLYLATAAMLYYLFAIWSDASEDSKNWIGLGVAAGVGLLSKASFVLIGAPVLVCALISDRWRTAEVSKMKSLLKAACLASLIAGPWWALNIKSSIDYAGYARNFTRNSLGHPSPATWIHWSETVLQGLLGYSLGALIALIAILYFGKVIAQRQSVLDALQVKVIGVCVCAGLPIVFVQLSGTNHLLRHVSPACIPLAIVVGVLADQTGVTRSKILAAVAGTLLCTQLLILVTPVLNPNKSALDSGLVNGSLPSRIMIRSDQWNWQAVQNIANRCGVEEPKISYLGNGRAFNQPQIEYPWAAKGRATDVKWLWRNEDGLIDWQKVMAEVELRDIVLTAPGYIGQISNGENLDNRYNSELVERLSRDTGFQKPIRLRMGRFEPIYVFLFVNNKLTCQSPEQNQVTR
jgi:4-amino-4-deoxy-L-arabinose transferase-like glycosyltransferase